MTKIFRWKEFPLCQPAQSGWYMINCKVNNMYITVMSFFDTATASWYEGTSKEKKIVGVAAFNPKPISG